MHALTTCMVHTCTYHLISLFPLHTQPKVVTDVDEEELRKQMEELQLANQEVAGDDDASDNEAGAENGDD